MPRARLPSLREAFLFVVGHCRQSDAEHVETAVDHSHRTGDELRGGADEVVNGAAQLLGLTHAAHRRLMDDVFGALCPAAVRIGEQRAVLVGEEEARRNGVDAFKKSNPWPSAFTWAVRWSTGASGMMARTGKLVKSASTAY